MKALITGITGQDGSYLAEFLLSKGYEVYGIIRRSSSFNTGRIDQIYQDPHVPNAHLRLVYGDLNDASSLNKILRTIRPDEIYNLGAQSHVRVSFDIPEYTAEVTGVGTVRLLEAIRELGLRPKFYQASSSEIFGRPREVPQNEETPLSPHTPYGVAKAYAHFIVGSYRRRYGTHSSSGILYNHESPRRPLDFLPRKVADAAARISLGLQEELLLGDLDARRDWGYAGDYVRAMWLMLQQETPGDYLVASGVSHSVEELVACAFEHVGLDWREHVRVDESLRRGKAELHHLVGDATLARERLGWEPAVEFPELVRLLVDADLVRLRAQVAAAAQ